jgi:hypothetical protein
MYVHVRERSRKREVMFAIVPCSLSFVVPLETFAHCISSFLTPRVFVAKGDEKVHLGAISPKVARPLFGTSFDPNLVSASLKGRRH